METYEIGKKFPNVLVSNKREVSVSHITDTFFDVITSLNNLTEKEIQCWKNGKLTLNIVSFDVIPFIAFDFEYSMSLDVTINILLHPEKEHWLASNGNVINMYLIDAKTGILKAIRTVNMQQNFANYIKYICQKQLLYNPVAIDNKIITYNTVVSTSEMIEKSLLKQQFQEV